EVEGGEGELDEFEGRVREDGFIGEDDAYRGERVDDHPGHGCPERRLGRLDSSWSFLVLPVEKHVALLSSFEIVMSGAEAVIVARASKVGEFLSVVKCRRSRWGGRGGVPIFCVRHGEMRCRLSIAAMR